MQESRTISLDDVKQSDVAICPECGILFVKTVKGVTSDFWDGRGFYCPVCEHLVAREDEKGKK
jgi:predicted RNA-binding Zn-ribbon protein involved in translation (DUF1610 family)